jgi:predicted HTH transcriptional regulator
VPAKSVGKSLFAVANHYGGWIFYGVMGATNGSNLPDSFAGLRQADVALLIQRLREAVREIIAPSPYYEYKILEGPDVSIGLPAERSIVVVAVSSDPGAPYVHNEGKIYRRVADASDPKAETDPHILEHLWQSRQAAREKLAAFINQGPSLSKGEENTTYIDVYFLPDPLGVSGQRIDLDLEHFASSR